MKSKKYTQGEHLKIGDTVEVVECFDGEAHNGQQGTITSAYKSGRVSVKLRDGDTCIASKVRLPSTEVVTRKKRHEPTFKQYVLDLLDNNPQRSQRELARVLGLTPSIISQWKKLRDKSPHKLRQYSPTLKAQWDARYFPENTPKVPSLEDTILAEEASRSYLLTEGEVSLSVLIRDKGQSLTVTVETDNLYALYAKEVTPEKVEAIGNLLLGAAKLARGVSA